MEQQKPNSSSSGQIIKLVVGMMLGIFLLIVLLLVLDAFKLISLRNFIPSKAKNIVSQLVPNSTGTVTSQNAVLKVGDETIYKTDYDIEDHYYPNIKSKTKQLLLNKLIKDSITLQQGAKENVITLDATFYNSSTKDYKKRIAKVAEVRSLIEKKQSRLQGSVVSIWFYNNSKPTTMEENAAKELARTKITPLYNAVKNHEISMQDAASRIKADSSLAAIDVAYKSNAIFAFDVTKPDQITFNKAFNDQINQLQQGQVTQLTLVQDKDIKTKKLRDAVYMFGQVTRRIAGNATEDYVTWLSKYEKEYSVIQY